VSALRRSYLASSAQFRLLSLFFTGTATTQISTLSLHDALPIFPAMRDERRRQQSENPPRGGGFQPLVGELRQLWVLSGNYAWDVAGQNAVPAAAERDLRSAVDGRLAQIWMTPHGFIKAATANHATSRTETVRGTKK